MENTEQNEKTELMARDDEPETNQMVRRSAFDVSLATENAATQALVAKATADIQARWVMAMRRPRDIAQVRQAMIKECKRPGFAKVALYHVPRGGGTIHGLSIRFAEVAMRCMTNMSCEAQTLFDSQQERVIRIVATDFETNVTWPRDITVKKTVERKQLKRGQRPLGERINSYEERVYIVEATDDDVATKEAALISKASRTAILRLIPGHLQDECRKICTDIANDENAKDPEGASNRMFDAFALLKIMPVDLEQWLGHPVDKSTPAEFTELGALHAAIKDGEVSWQEALDAADERRARAKKAGANAKPAQPSPTPAAAIPPKETAKPAPAKPTGGKGTQAVKDAITQNKKTEPPKVEPKPEPKPEPPKAVETSRDDDEEDIPVPPESSSPPGYEERNCFGCGVPIEVKIEEPAEAKCYACRAADGT